MTTGPEVGPAVLYDVTSPAKYFLLWFTRAAPSREQTGRYRLEVDDIKLIE